MSDDEFPWSSTTSATRKRLIRQILWTLHLDGPFEDEQTGRATALFAEGLAHRGARPSVGVLNSILKDLENAEYILRKIQGKRCYSIRLVVDVSEPWFPENPFLTEPKPKPKLRKAVVTEPQIEPVVEAEETETETEPAIEINGRSASAQVVAVVSPEPAPDFESSYHDKILYAISLLNDAVLQKAMEPAIDFERVFDKKASAFMASMAELDELRAENLSLKADKARLIELNRQAQNTIERLRPGGGR